MCLNNIKIGLWSAVMLAMLATTTNVNAELVFDHSVSVEAGAAYHSNIQLLQQDKESVYLYTLRPVYGISVLDGKNEWLGNVGLFFERSSNSTVSSNREDPFGNIGWKRILENGLIGLDFAYEKASSRNTQFTETGLFSRDGTEVRRSITADWERLITEKLDFALQAKYEKIKFSGAQSLADYDSRYIYADLFYAMTEKIKPFFRFGLNDFRTAGPDGNRIKYQDYIAGATFEVGPGLSFSAGAGVTHFSSLESSTSRDKNEWVGVMKVDYLANKYDIHSELSRRVEPTAIGNILVEDRLAAEYVYNLSSRSELGAYARLTQNDVNRHTQDAGGFYRHNLTESWSILTTLGVRNSKSEGSSSVNDNVIGFNLTYNFDPSEPEIIEDRPLSKNEINIKN